jgi:outer membrane protein assembly factor BamB
MNTFVQSLFGCCLFLTLAGLFLFPEIGNSITAQHVSDRHVQVEHREARTLLRKADSLRNSKRYSEAAATYLQLLKAHSHKAIRVNERRFAGVHKTVRQRVSQMDREGKKKMRKVFRQEASHRYERAIDEGNLQSLRTVASVYWMTGPGRKAMQHLARVAYKRGRLKTAIHWWTEHLKSETKEKASHSTKARIQHVMDQLPGQVTFHDLREQLDLDQTNPSSSEHLDLNWPRPGGNNTGTGRVSSVLESYEVPEQARTSGRELITLWTESSVGKSQSNGTHFAFSPLQPIVYRGMILVNDGSHLFAYGLEDEVIDSLNARHRRLLWTYPDVKRRMEQRQIQSLSSGEQGYRIRSLVGYNGSIYAHVRDRLHKIDPTRGRSIFVSDPPKVNGKYLSFNGTPVVTEHGVFVPLVRPTVGNRGQLYIARYGHEHGRLDWYRFMGVTNMENFADGRRNANPANMRKLIHLLSRGNDIFAATNMGVTASINAVTGHLNWVYDYSSLFQNHGQEGSNLEEWSPSASSGRGLQPPRIIQDSLYVLPWDSPYFLGFDLQNGTTTVQYPMPDATGFLDHGFLNMFDGHPTAILIKEDSSGAHLTVLPLKADEIEEQDIELSFSLRPAPSPGVHRLLLGGAKKLRSIRRENMLIKYDAAWPAQNQIDQFELIATGDHIILVGPGGIAVLTTSRAIFRNVVGSTMHTGVAAQLFPY